MASVPRLFRVILPVSDIEAAAKFYEQLLGIAGQRVSPGRHYFNLGGTILACFDPRADGDDFDLPANPEHLYIAVADLEKIFVTAASLGCRQLEYAIQTRPWGERSFYLADPFGNKICLVDQLTVYTGQS